MEFDAAGDPMRRQQVEVDQYLLTSPAVIPRKRIIRVRMIPESRNLLFQVAPQAHAAGG
jgi:hypothetical protein